MDDVKNQLESQEFQDQIKKADELAKVLVKHITNDKGELLANIEENAGF